MLKKSKQIGLILACCISLWGCSFFPDGTSYVTGDKKAEVHTEEDNKIVGKINDATNINAQIYVPENVEWCNYKVKRRMVETNKRQQLAKYLSYEMKVPQEIEGESMGEKRYDYEYSDTSSLNFSPASVRYDTSQHKELQHSSYILKNGNIRSDIADCFPNSSIEGFSKEEALETAQQICEILGIEVGDNPDIVAIDSEHANSMKEEDELLGMDKYGEKTRDWTKEDEAYFIQYKVKWNGVLLSDCSKSDDSNSYYSNYFNIIIGREKIVRINFVGLYDIESSETVAEQDLCPVSKVLDILASRGYYSKGMTGQGEITKISLNYVVKYTSATGEWSIVPCWICDNNVKSTTVKDGKEYIHSQYQYIHIDPVKKVVV